MNTAHGSLLILMPEMDGYQVLAHLQANDTLSTSLLVIALWLFSPDQ